MIERPLAGRHFEILGNSLIEPQRNDRKSLVQQRMRAFMSQVDIQIGFAVGVNAGCAVFEHEQGRAIRRLRKMLLCKFAILIVTVEEKHVNRTLRGCHPECSRESVAVQVVRQTAFRTASGRTLPE